MNNIDYEKERKKYTQAILDSTAPYKLIVAGPGTGKTYAFKELLRIQSNKNNLVLTFINNLVNDLNNELNDLAEAKTFHSLCTHSLYKYKDNDLNNRFIICPYLNKIVEKDYELFEEEINDIISSFQNLEEDKNTIQKFLTRSNYYNSVSFDDCVYRVIEKLKMDHSKIPEYNLVLVDEFQDFNKLEVEIIKLLAIKNNLLIVGDDDQAIYERRNATPEYIRRLYNNPKFEKFGLPFCNRCTEVIIKTVNKIIKKSIGSGNLLGHINKEYKCYIPDKSKDNKLYPKIKFASCTVNDNRTPYMAKYIESEIIKIPEHHIIEARKKNIPCVLIIGPGFITDTIINHEFKTGYIMNTTDKTDQNINIHDAIKYLLDNENSNLGWRIILQLKYMKFLKKILHNSRNTLMSNHIPVTVKEEVKDILNHIRQLKNGTEIGLFKENQLENFLGYPMDELKKQFIGDNNEQIYNKSSQFDIGPSIKVTTFEGSKGLQAFHVFVVGLHDGFLPKNKNAIEDIEICKFIVALTRTIKQCHLIYNIWHYDSRIKRKIQKDRSVFIDWINSDDIEYIDVDKTYFK